MVRKTKLLRSSFQFAARSDPESAVEAKLSGKALKAYRASFKDPA
jgi:hypothetical protein